MVDHHVVRDLLPAYVAGELEPATEREVAEHLDGCPECRTAADAADGPVALPAPEQPPSWSEARLRRGVRRALWRTAFDAVSLLLVLAVVGWLASAFVVQPFIARDGRAETALTATFDLPLLRTPGGHIESWWSEADGLDRVLRIDVVRRIGGDFEGLATVTSHLGPWSWAPSTSDGNSDGSLVSSDDAVVWAPERLPAQSAVTMFATWDEPVPSERVDAAAAADATLLWAAFDLRPALEDASDQAASPQTPDVAVGPAGPELPGWSLGYSTCQQPRFPDGLSWAGSSGGSTGGTTPTAGLEHALEQLRRATTNLASDDDITAAVARTPVPAFHHVRAVADWLETAQPNVAGVAVTGTVEAVDEFVQTVEPDAAWQLGARLYNGEREGC